MPKPARPPETDVLIVGFKKPDVARLLAEHLTQSGVTSTLFMGKRARSDFLAEMARARVVVCLPGTREGFYLPALEAMAVGALTVCPDARGNDYCRDGFNCFKPEYDVAALTRAVLRASRLSADQAAEICRNASATARQHDLALERTRFLRVLRAASTSGQGIADVRSSAT